VAGGASWAGCVESGDTCGLLLNSSIRFFGAAVAGARFFFGFRPRLLGIGKQWVAGQIGRDLDLIQKGKAIAIGRLLLSATLFNPSVLSNER
jgi:hypothetical protein